MIIIALVRSDSLSSLKKAHDGEYEFSSQNELTIMGEWFTRVAFQCDILPEEGLDITIEEIVKEKRYCYICSSVLRGDNLSGYCKKCQDKNPWRSQRKRKSKLA